MANELNGNPYIVDTIDSGGTIVRSGSMQVKCIVWSQPMAGGDPCRITSNGRLLTNLFALSVGSGHTGELPMGYPFMAVNLTVNSLGSGELFIYEDSIPVRRVTP